MAFYCPNGGVAGDPGYLIKGHAGIVGHIDIARSKLPKLDVQAGTPSYRSPSLRQPIRCSLTGAPGEDELGFDRPHCVKCLRTIEDVEYERCQEEHLRLSGAFEGLVFRQDGLAPVSIYILTLK